VLLNIAVRSSAVIGLKRSRRSGVTGRGTLSLNERERVAGSRSMFQARVCSTLGWGGNSMKANLYSVVRSTTVRSARALSGLT
jgi:hypothetical protein